MYRTQHNDGREGEVQEVKERGEGWGNSEKNERRREGGN